LRPRELIRLCFTHPVLKYVTALVATLAAVLVRYELTPVLHDQSRYFLILPVMIVWSIYGGLGPGLLVAVLGSILTVVLIVSPSDAPGALGTDANSFVLHCLMCAGFLWVTDREVKEKRRREATEAELERLNEELEAKVAERTAALVAANAEMESFCYSMAHDLRTPGRAISGHARILIEDHAADLPEALRSHLERMDSASNKLGALIDALLLYARLGHMEMSLSDLDVPRLVRELAEAEARAAGVDLSLDLEEGLILHADERLMRILILAIVRNSILYRKSESSVRIHLRREGDSMVFEDEGIGFDMAYVGKVFLPFERLHRQDQYPGEGMGLANVARVVERHHGAATIHSTPGRGTAVRISMPGLTKRTRELAGVASGVR
jgi:signal transduction histidine kinase